MLTIFNTLTGQKDVFVPLVPKTVRIYACGVTVYDESHIGHARSALTFDVIRNYLRFSGYAVTYVRNFTDVDDKIIARAAKDGVPCQEIVNRYLHAYQRDMARLRIPVADVEPKATEHMPEIVRMIQTLLEKGHAYVVNGDVYFEVGSYPAYGRLSKRKMEDLLAGARVEVDERKRHPMDFALWKSSKPGEPTWASPWGPGRPGWHIECSAMSVHYLGASFDIHGGGMDLIFPHHENEIAQSCAATGQEFARWWVHNGFVEINREKMSKSLGNFFTVREVFESSGCRESVTAETLRYFLLGSHYRSPLDFSDHGLREAKRALDGLYGLFQRLEEQTGTTGRDDAQVGRLVERFKESFQRAMDDDFNTPAALAHFQHLRGEVNRLLATGLSAAAAAAAHRTFRTFGHVLGLFQLPVREWEFKDLEFRIGASGATGQARLSDADIERLLAERNEARRRKNFARADEIRASLSAQGIAIEDRPDGTSRWKR